MLPQDTRRRLFTMNEEEKGKKETSLFDISFKNMHYNMFSINDSTSIIVYASIPVPLQGFVHHT